MKVKKRIRYNIIFFIIMVLAIVNIGIHYIRLNKQKEQVLSLYKGSQQVSTDLLTILLKQDIEGYTNWDRDWSSRVSRIMMEVTNDSSVWAFVSCEGDIVYYKMQNLEKDYQTIPYDQFIESHDSNTLVVTQKKIQVNNEDLIVGLVKPQRLVLIDTEYNHMYSMLMLENVIVTFLLTMIGCFFCWKTIRLSRVKEKTKSEIVQLNQKLEQRNQEIKQQNLVNEIEATQDEISNIQYDKDLLVVLLEKANVVQYYPIGIQIIRYYMGNLYFTRDQMKIIEKQLQEQVSGYSEVFETGKGEFVFIILKKKAEEIDTLFERLREKAESIAKQNQIEVHSSKKVLTGVVSNLNDILKEQLQDLSIF